MDLDTPRVDTSPSMVYMTAPKLKMDWVRQQSLVRVKSKTFSSCLGKVESLYCIPLMGAIIIFTGLQSVS